MSSEGVFDRLVEKAKMGDKADLERAVNLFIKTYKTEGNANKRKRKSPYLQPNTRVVYWNFIRKVVNGRVIRFNASCHDSLCLK